MTFEDVAQELLADHDVSLGKGVGDDEIAHASRTLGIPIAGAYREFLRRFGWGGVPGYRLWGLGSGIPSYLDLVAMTESERTECEPNIAHHLLPIMNDGGGNHVCLDTRASPDEPPVVWWYHEDGPDQVPEQDAPDFLTWLAKVLKERKDQQ